MTDARELCFNCRTERVPAALGAEVEGLDIEELEPEAVAPSFTLAPRFVGRRGLVDQLTSTVEQSRSERELKFVALVGPSGVGKTRVLQELARRVQSQAATNAPAARVLYSVAGGPSSLPFQAFRRLLCERFGISEGEAQQVACDRIQSGVNAILPAARATEVAHLIGQLVGYPFLDSVIVEPLAETPSQLEARTFIAIRRLIAADAERAPLVIIIDEIERTSPETVNLIHYLAAGLASSPVTILASGLPTLFEIHPSFGAGDVPLTAIDVGPLGSDEAAELLSELLRPAGPPPKELIDHVRDRMEGVPRALVELVRLLLEVGVIVESELGVANWKYDRIALRHAQLPVQLEGIIAERLRVMESSERSLLEKAAACGETFWLDAVVALVRAAALDSSSGRGDPDGPTLGEVAAAGDRTRGEVDRALKVLERRGIVTGLVHASIPGEREYRFSYPPWWDCVYEGIDTEARRRYHRLVAQWLELRPEGRGEEAQEEIGRHLERAGDGEGAALRYRRGADAARARYFNDKAIRLYVAALGCLGPGDLAARIHLWHDLGSVFHLKGEFDSALGAFERMLRLSWVVASRTKAAVAFNKMGRIYREKGELPIALEYLERGLELFEQAGDERGIAGSLDDIGQVLWLSSRYDEALDRSAAGLESRRRIGDRRSIAASLTNIGHIERHRGLFDEAEACYREALEIRVTLGDRLGIAQAKNGLGVLSYQRGDIEGARRIWEEALAETEYIGALPFQALLLNHLGEAARTLGHRGEAQSRFESAEQLAREVDDRRLLSEALRNLGLLDLETGSPVRALERCNQALEIAEQAGIRVDVGRALIALGEVYASTLFGDADSATLAQDYFRRGVDLFRSIGNDAELALALERFGRYEVEHGDMGLGKITLTEAQSIFERLGMRAGVHLSRVIGEL